MGACCNAEIFGGLAGGRLVIEGLLQHEAAALLRAAATAPQWHPAYGFLADEILDAMEGDGVFLLKPSDTFFWAVAAGSWELAHTLWSSTDDPLRCALMGSLSGNCDQRVDLGLGAEAEGAKEYRNVSIVGVEPELEERIRAGQFWIEPHGSRFGLAEFGSVRLGEQRRCQRVNVRSIHTAHQIDAGRDVPPLVRSPRLQDALVLPE